MFADGAYGGNKLAGALKQAHCPVTVEVVKKAKDDKGFTVIPGVGRSSGASDGCGAADASRRTSSDPSPVPSPGSGWLWSAFSYAASHETK